MVVIPMGSFTITRKPAADGRKDDDPPGAPKTVPARDVTFNKVFATSIYDVTRDEYATFVSETGGTREPGCYVWSGDQWIEDLDKDWRNPGFHQSGQDPVVCVSWHDAQAYLSWLSRKLAPASRADAYRLLSWEEAEYVGRAGVQTAYNWGDRPGRDKANYGADRCFPCKGATSGRDRWRYTSPVRSFPPNAFGVYDMAGNVWQWTDGCFPYRNPPIPTSQCRYGARYGGSWLDNPEYLRIDAYAINDHLNRNTATGFRVARSLD